MDQLLAWFLCLLPIAVLLVSIVVVRAGVPVAAGIGLAVAILSGAAIGAIGDGELVEGFSSGATTALSILYAVWPAMFLYDVMRESGAFGSLRRLAESATRDTLALILLFAWVFSSFLQSITGFGVPVAVCAPFLVALGVRPVPAVVMTLVGHSWGNTFGTLGMAWDALAAMGPVEDEAGTAILAGALLWIVNLSGGALVAFIYGRGRALAHGLPLIAALSTVMGGGQMALAGIDATLACFIPTTAALILFAFIIKLGFYKKSWNCPSSIFGRTGEAAFDAGAPSSTVAAFPATNGARPSSQVKAQPPIPSAEAPSTRETLLSASPFVFLTAASIVLFAIPATKELASIPQVAGIPLFGHAGFALLVSCIFALLVMKRAGRLDPQGRMRAARKALCRLRGASAGIILLVIMAQIMQATGQMQILAEGIARAAGSLYIPLAPAVGTLGAFATSSNMSSNILLASFQHAMAGNLEVDSALVLAAQTAGGAAGAAIGPSTILMGATTVGAFGKEGAMLKPLLAISFTQAALLGIVVLAFSSIAT